MALLAILVVVIGAIIESNAGPAGSKPIVERRIEYVVVWTGDAAELTPHVRNLLENSIEDRETTLVVDSESHEEIRDLIEKRATGIYQFKKLTLLTERDVFRRYRDRKFKAVLSVKEAEKLHETYSELPNHMKRMRRDALVLAYLCTIGDNPTFIHGADTEFGIPLTEGGVWNRIETFEDDTGGDPEYQHRRTDHVTAQLEPDFMRLRGMKTIQFSVYGNNEADSKNAIASRSYLSDVPDVMVLERRNMKFTPDLIYAPSSGSVAEIARQSVIVRDTLELVTYKAEDDGKTYTIKEIVNGPPNHGRTFTDTVTGDSALRVSDIFTRYENSILTTPMEGYLQTVFDRDYYRPPADAPHDFVVVNPYGLVGDVRLGGDFDRISTFMQQNSLDAAQFAVSVDLQLVAEASFPALLNDMLPDLCESGYSSDDTRKKRSARRRGGDNRCFLNPDDYDHRKFRRTYDFEYDPATRSVSIFGRRVIWIVTHPKVVAKTFDYHARKVTKLAKNLDGVLSAHAVAVDALLTRLRPSDVSVDRVSRVMKNHGVPVAKKGKGASRWLPFVTVMLGANDLRTPANGSNEEFYRVFAITDITESTFQLLNAVTPARLMNGLANNKFLGRFNSFGQIFQALDLTKNVIQNGGIRSPEEMYWVARTIMNTISIASRTLGRVFLPLIAVDIAMILEATTNTARTTLHETMTELHLTRVQRTALYWDGFTGNTEVISEFRKSSAMKRGIDAYAVKATEVLANVKSAKAVVIPFRRGSKLVNKRRYVSEGTRSGWSGFGGSCSYETVEDPVTFVYGISKTGRSIDYTTVNFSGALPTKTSFRGDEHAFDLCLELAGSYCRYDELSYIERYAMNSHSYIRNVPVKLSRCPITGADGKDIVFRPADDYADWCELEAKFKTEIGKRWDRIVSSPLRRGEPDSLTRPTVPGVEFDLVDFPYGEMRESATRKTTEYYTFVRGACPPEGKTKYSQIVTNVMDSPSDLIVSVTDKSERDRVVFYPASNHVLLPDKSIAYLYFSGTILWAGTDSLVVTDIKKTYGTKLRVTDRFSGRLAMTVTAGSDKLIINTDTINAPIPGLFENDTLTKHYLELLTGPGLTADWLDSLYAPDVDAGLVFVGPMTRYVRVGKAWTVVTYGDFANVIIEAGFGTKVYQTSERSIVRVVEI